MDKGQYSILLVILFYTLLWNTSYFWENLPGLVDVAIFLLLILLSFILLVIGIVQLFKSFGETSKRKFRLINSSLIATVLTLSILKPTGLINMEALEGEDLLIAVKEGVANCRTIIKLKPNQRFKKTNYCFGVEHYWGNHTMNQDTLTFHYDNNKKEYAIVELNDAQDQKYLHYHSKEAVIQPVTFYMVMMNTKAFKE